MSESFSPPFTHNKHLVSTYSESGSILDTGDTQVSKRDLCPDMKELSGNSKDGSYNQNLGGFSVSSLGFFTIFFCNFNFTFIICIQICIICNWENRRQFSFVVYVWEYTRIRNKRCFSHMI